MKFGPVLIGLVAATACRDTELGAVPGVPDPANRLSGGELEVPFPVPFGTDLAYTALGGGHVQITDRDEVEGLIASDGNADVGNDSEVGDIIAKGNVYIGHRSAAGHVSAGGAATVEPTAEVEELVEGALVSTGEAPALAFDVPVDSYGTLLLNWGQYAEIQPSRYDSIILNSGATLKLTAGTYFVDTFIMNWASTVEIDDQDGPVVLVVGDYMTNGGEWVDLYETSLPNLLVAYLGTNMLVLDTPFNGFIVAPNGTLRLAGNGVEHEGSFFAKDLIVSPDITVEHRAFDYLNLVAQLQIPPLDPDKAPEADVSDYVADDDALLELGKALFWDMNVGQDGQACATCHYNAGADVRVKNQISPGVLDRVNLAVAFEPFYAGGGGANYTLAVDDFPLHRLSDPNDRESAVVHDSGNDVISSAGNFRGFITFDVNGGEICNFVADPLFHVGPSNTRKVEPRNAPTTVNAIFNFRQFWDGRANNVFNGVNPFGLRDPDAVVYRSHAGTAQPEHIAIVNASLASQAVGPVLSFFEMNCGDGTASFPRVARRVFGHMPLAGQAVAPDDSVLGGLRDGDGFGLNKSYPELIRQAFRSEWWDAANTIDGFSQMEQNFSLFFGIAVMRYEATLISEQTRFDEYASGNSEALTDAEKHGFEVFSGKGKCINCHHGPEFTGAGSPAFREHEEGGLVERMEMAVGVALYDTAFYNIGVTPTFEDIGVGNTDPFGNPLSFTRQEKIRAGGGDAVDPFETDPNTFESNPGVAVDPNERDAVDGAFKVPTLRNVELTGPYFHNGGQATLREVVEFYNRGGDRRSTNNGCDTTEFGPNCSNLDPDITSLGLTSGEIDDLVAFLHTLTDDRVRYEQAPFDHPSLTVSAGHSGDNLNVFGLNAQDELVTIPASGADGRTSAIPAFEDVLYCADGDDGLGATCFDAAYN